MIPVILSGGHGSRLWPLSRKNKPKQFLTLLGEQTLFQQALSRLDGLDDLQAPIIVCNNKHRFMVAEQLQQLETVEPTIILEPVSRNTAPALAIAALQSMSKGDDPILLALAADHLIQDIPTFHRAISEARLQAEAGLLVTFGIVPTSANVAYGYIQVDEMRPVSKIKSFVEKPDADLAKSYVVSGDYYWNSGMFVFKASTLIAELKQYSPDLLNCCREALAKSRDDLDFIRLGNDAFEGCYSNSIDYAVMEHTDKAVVIPLDVAWNDVGTWDALWASSPHDDDGNTLQGDVMIDDVKNSYVHSENRLVSVLGLDDVIVVETADAVLVSHKKSASKIRNIVQGLTQEKRREVDSHRLHHRPWGSYELLTEGDNHLVKHIIVKPRSSLSLQLHHHRAEHWIVVKGTAQVTCDGDVSVLAENESTFIPVGIKHRLHNPTESPLEIIEVQTGAYLGEDDIVRFEG